MAAGINDKFKKVSADNSYGVATTVKTARTVGGGTTLEAFDLSRWADATAVNFLTYRKTTDPVTNITTVTNRTGWTALVNTGSNTLTNLTIAPGYADLGHQVGDYIEPVQMSKWANDLVDGILVSHNQDGTLKANSVTTAAIRDGAVKAQNVDFATLSTTGKLVGVTDDGKNIYERVFNGNMTAAAGSRLVTTITFAGITGIINASGYITTSSGRILALGQTWHDAGGTNEASGSAVFYDSGTISIITRSDQARSNSPYKLVLRYTNA